jgi:hypothetical protein
MDLVSFFLGFACGFIFARAAVTAGVVLRGWLESRPPRAQGGYTTGGVVLQSKSTSYDTGTDPRPFADGAFEHFMTQEDLDRMEVMYGQRFNPRGKP